MAEGTLTIKFLGDPSKLKSDFDTLGSSAGTFEGKIEGASSKFGNFASIAGGIVAAGALQKIGGFLKDGATGAMEDAAAMDRLKVAVENTGVSFDTRSKSIDEAIKKGQSLAFSDGDVMAALTNLTNATGDSDEALRRLTLAQDLARGTGMSLEQASKLLGKTSDENTATLARYGIQLDKNATAQDVMNEVDKRFGGQAAAFAESDAGKWAQLQLQMTELQETIGGMLIPVFSLLVTVFAGVMTALQPVTDFIGNNIQPIMLGLAAAISVIVIPAFVAWAIAAGAAALATITAMAPVLAIAAAVGIAVAALYLAWSTNFLGIRDITQQVIDFVRPYVETALAAIQTAFDTVLPYVTAAVETAWGAIQVVFETVFPIIQTIVETYVLAWQTIIETALGIILGIFQTVWPVIQGVVATILPIIASVVETYIGAILTVVQTVLPLVQAVFSLVWDGIKLYVDTVLGLIATAVSVGMYLIKDIIGPILGALKSEVWDPIWNGIKATVDTVIGVAGGVGGVVGSVTTGLGDVVSAITGKLEDLRDNVWNPIWNGLKGTVDTVVDAVKGAWNFVAGVVNSALTTWNNLSLSFDTHIPGIGTIHWESPNVPLLPTFGGGSGGGGYTAYGAGGGGDWVNGGSTGGTSPGSGGGTGNFPGSGAGGPGGGGDPPGASAPSGGYAPPVPVYGDADALAGLGNQSSGSSLGSVGRGGAGRGGAISQEQADTAAQLIAQGVPADVAVAAATTVDRFAYQGGPDRRADMASHWSGRYAFGSRAEYEKVQLSSGLHGFKSTGDNDIAAAVERGVRRALSGAN